MILGIDLSKWDTPIDLQDAKNNGVSFGIHQICNGLGLQDRFWDAHYKNTVNAGIHVGAYQFWQAELDPEQQAINFLNKVANYLAVGAYVIDIEDAYDVYGTKVPSYKISERARRWVKYVEDHSDKTIIIYTATWFINAFCKELLSWIPNYSLWLAYYPNTFPKGDAVPWSVIKAGVDMHPATLMDNTLNYKLKGKWDFWQISEHTRPPLFRDTPDINVFNGTQEELAAIFNGSIIDPIPPDEFTPYQIQVITVWGVKIRSEPTDSYNNQVGSLAYNAKTIIYEESDDKLWGRITYPLNGWVTLQTKYVKKI